MSCAECSFLYTINMRKTPNDPVFQWLQRLPIILACLLAPPISQAAELLAYPVDTPAARLALDDLSGIRHVLGDYRGQVVLVNFWASWCPPCIIEMPGMQRLQEKLAGRPFTILAVNVRETPGTIWKFRKLVRVSFPLLLDPEGQAAADWGIDAYPSSFLVDPRGRVRYAAYGPRQWDAPEIIGTIESLMDSLEGQDREQVVSTGNVSRGHP